MKPAAPDFGEWRHPNCPFVVDYSRVAMEQIRSHVTEGYYSMPRGGAETGGVLFGSNSGGRVLVAAARRAVCEHAMGPSFTLSLRDEAAFQRLLDCAGRDELAGLQAVGWYHSHTRTGLQLSDHDVDLWKRYFPKRWQLALVLKPANMGLMRAAFFFRDAEGLVERQPPYGEFELAAPSRPLAEDTLAACQPETGPPPAPESLPAPARAVETAPPQFASAGAPAAPRRLWLSMLAMAAASATALGLHQGWDSIAALWRKPPVALRTERDGAQLLIRWNPAASAVERATAATLHIEDGDATSALVLDAGRLHRGIAEYTPRSSPGAVRLILRQPDGRTVVESLVR